MQKFMTNAEKLQAAKDYHIHLTMDAAPYNLPNSGVPAIFTAAFVPTIIKQVLAPLFFSEIATPMQQGDFVTNNVIFMKSDWSGENKPYVDYSIDGQSDANVNFEDRDVYRFQNVQNYGDLEVETYSAINFDIITQKREAAAYVIGRDINSIGFVGVEGKKTYGLLNDPSLAPAIVFPASAANPSSSKWIYKIPVEIIKDMQLLAADIATRSDGNFRLGAPGQEAYLLVSPEVAIYLTTPTEFNLDSSPLSWIQKQFPGLQVLAVPEYRVGDSSAGDKVQLILKTFNGLPVVGNLFTYLFRAHNVEVHTSSYLQKFSAGTAGAGVLQPTFISTGTGA